MSTTEPILFLAIDPGKASGTALYIPEQQRLYLDTLTPEDTFRLIDTFHGGDITIFIEKYEIRPDTHKKTRQYDAMDLVGATRHSEVTKGTIRHVQTPGHAKNGATNETLDEVSPSLRSNARTDHEVDAIRHLYVGLANHYPQQWQQFYRAAHDGELTILPNTPGT